GNFGWYRASNGGMASLMSHRFPIVVMLATIFASDAAGQIYDPDPRHPWNLLHEALLVRTTLDGQRVGEDSLHPLRGNETKFLRTRPSRAAGIAAADAFLQQHAERRFADDLLRRVILQRDLWTIFDSLANGPETISALPGVRMAADDRPLRDRLAQI